MDFEPTPEERALAGRAARLVTEALPELPEEPGAFTRRAWVLLADAGLLAQETAVGAALAVAELSRSSASLAAVFAEGWAFGAALSRHRGPTDALTAEARRGAILGCLALQESPRGAAGGVRVQAGAQGDVLVGALPSVACANVASSVVVFARGDDDATARLLSLDPSRVGVIRGRPRIGVGLVRAARADLELRGALVSDGAPLAAGEAAVAAHRALLDLRHMLAGALAAGVARRAQDAAIEHVRATGWQLSQSTDFMLSDMATLLDAAELSVLRAALLWDRGEKATIESSGAKLLSTRAATRIAHDALVICAGGETDGLRRAYLDAHFLETNDGVDAVQVDTIASELLEE